MHYYFDIRDEVLIAALKWSSGELLPGCETVSPQWRELFRVVVRRGRETGDFAPVGRADEVAERLVAISDGLVLETTLGYRWTAPEPMHQRLLQFAAEQLGVDGGALAAAAEAAR